MHSLGKPLCHLWFSVRSYGQEVDEEYMHLVVSNKEDRRRRLEGMSGTRKSNHRAQAQGDIDGFSWCTYHLVTFIYYE